MNLNNPIDVIKAAIKAVPQIKYGIAVLGLIVIISLIPSYVKDFAVAFYGCIALIILMILVFIFQRVTQINANKIEKPVLLIIWVFACSLSLALILIGSSFFFQWPKNFTNNNVQPILNRKEKESNTTTLALSNKINGPGKIRNVSHIATPKLEKSVCKFLFIPSELNDTVKEKIAQILHLRLGNESNRTLTVRFGYQTKYTTPYPDSTSEYLAHGKVIVTVNSHQPFIIETDEISRIPRTVNIQFHQQLKDEISRIVSKNLKQICAALKKNN